MTILTALASAYDRLAAEGRAPAYGYSAETIHYVISLNADGSVAQVAPLGDGKTGRAISVPQAVKRSSGIAANFLWDKTGYVLGVAASKKTNEADADYAKRTRRLPEMHAAFVQRQREALEGTDDEGLVALLRFLDAWRPEDFAAPDWPDDMRDRNVVFALESERLGDVRLHDRPAAQAVWRGMNAAAGEGRPCLVSGARGPVARLHPRIKGIRGPSGKDADSLISYNQPAFKSYGNEKGEIAQISESSAAAYVTALNTLLAWGSKNRVQIGDASTVFWADVSGAQATMVENLFGAMMQGPDQKAQGPDQRAQDRRIGDMLELLRRGRADALEPALTEGVRLHVLALAPNAARLSVRFWLSDSFGRIAKNYARYAQDMAIDPPPNPPLPGFWSLLFCLLPEAKQRKLRDGKRLNEDSDYKALSLLASEWLRAVLTGGRYPATLLATTLIRIRADKKVADRRAMILSAFLRRNHQWEAPVSLDPDNPSQAYQLGRLFAVLEQAQRAALGRVNATIADRYYAAASSTPARVFGPLLRGLQVHVSDARKRNLGGWISPKVDQIMLKLAPDLPTSLTLEDQARFAIGYYHEKATRHGKPAGVLDDAQDGQEDASND